MGKLSLWQWLKLKNNWSLFPKALSEEGPTIPILREGKQIPGSLAFSQAGTRRT